MQAAQWGWLHSTPKGLKQNRFESYGYAYGIDQDIDGQYLIYALSEIGWGVCQSYSPWAELRAYSEALGGISEPWEYRAIMAMSRAYIRAIEEGKDVHCIPPVERENDG